MDPRHDEHEAIILEFKKQLKGMDLDDLRAVAGQVLQYGESRARAAARLNLRRPPLDGLHVLRIRAELDASEPPIWRELDVRSDITLDVLHMVMQAAFGWTDSHLHRFAAGGQAFDPKSQIFLCPYDAADPDLDEAGGIPANQVRIDELLQQPGDTLGYLYDYGDCWEVTIRLGSVTPASGDAPEAVAVAGERAAPPEDSGGGVDLAAMSLAVDDPSHFDLHEVQQALESELLHGSLGNIDGRLSSMGMRLGHTPLAEELHEVIVSGARGRCRLSDDEVAEAMGAHQWFLERASDGGIPLTSAGYLMPADVEAASAVVPAMSGWIGKNNRESLAPPLLDFRSSMQKSGLLRKYKGALLLTRRGAAARRDPQALWDTVAAGCVEAGESFDAHATLLVLAWAAAAPMSPLPMGRIVAVLNAIGWRQAGGAPVDELALVGLPIFDTLANVTCADTSALGRIERGRISDEASALARAALRIR